MKQIFIVLFLFVNLSLAQQSSNLEMVPSKLSLDHVEFRLRVSSKEAVEESNKILEQFRKLWMDKLGCINPRFTFREDGLVWRGSADKLLDIRDRILVGLEGQCPKDTAFLEKRPGNVSMPQNYSIVHSAKIRNIISGITVHEVSVFSDDGSRIFRLWWYFDADMPLDFSHSEISTGIETKVLFE